MFSRIRSYFNISIAILIAGLSFASVEHNHFHEESHPNGFHAPEDSHDHVSGDDCASLHRFMAESSFYDGSPVWFIPAAFFLLITVLFSTLSVSPTIRLQARAPPGFLSA